MDPNLRNAEYRARHLKLLEVRPEVSELGEIMSVPIFTNQVRLRAWEMAGKSRSGGDADANKTNASDNNDTIARPRRPFPQYGLLGGDASADYSKLSVGGGDAPDPRIFLNVAAPSSVFICGSQGTGKSHTLSCILENCLIPCDANFLPRPLTGVVFHYDTFISDAGGQPCEVAHLGSNPNIKVRVICPPTNIQTMKRIYSKLPNVTVTPLRLNESDLNTKRMLDLMAVNDSQGIPLYLHVIQRILRDLRIEQQETNTPFQYHAFKKMLDQEDLTQAQKAPLKQRLDTLESFMVRKQACAYNYLTTTRHSFGRRNIVSSEETQQGTDWTPKVVLATSSTLCFYQAGQLTIVDLSCPCVTPETACSLFNICLSLFLEQESERVGRVVALDEAHKYMTSESADCRALTESLLATIRLQRHQGARVIISTQEPTISPTLLDLCSVTVVHRFTSPAWLQVLRQHLAGVSAAAQMLERAEKLKLMVGNGDGAEQGQEDVAGVRPIGFEVDGGGRTDPALELFSRIVGLRLGEALLFAPSAAIGVVKKETEVGEQDPGQLHDGHPHGPTSRSSVFRRLGHGVLHIRIRNRVTADGGRSVMAS